MKKTGLFKITMYVLLGIVLLSWIFSASYFSEGQLMELGMYQLGFMDFFQLLFASLEFQYFLQILLLLLAVGALYGVLNKTGKYRAWIERIVNNFKGAELVLIIIIAFAMAALTSLFNYGFMLFIFIPFLISIILAMGYDKITACLATFGATLIGNVGSTLAASYAMTINDTVGIETTTESFIARLILFVLSFIILVIFLAKAKRHKIVKEQEDDMFLGEKISNKYSIVPIIVTFSLLLIVMVLGCTNWKTTFKQDIFETMHTKITEFEVKVPTFNITSEGLNVGMEKTKIFGKILGNAKPLGNWSYPEMTTIVLVATFIIALFYRIKLKDAFNYMADGAQKMLKPAILVTFIFTVIYFAGNTMFYPTIAKYILGVTKGFNIAFTTLTLILGSFLHIDILYLASYVIPQIAAQDVNGLVVSLLSQGIHGVTMFIAPTSVMIALGLSYIGISYKEWIKNTWKIALMLFTAVIVVTFAVMIIL